MPLYYTGDWQFYDQLCKCLADAKDAYTKGNMGDAPKGGHGSLARLLIDYKTCIDTLLRKRLKISKDYFQRPNMINVCAFGCTVACSAAVGVGVVSVVEVPMLGPVVLEEAIPLGSTCIFGCTAVCVKALQKKHLELL